MTCNNNCNQGRNCDCNKFGNRATVIVTTLLFVAVVSMGFGVWKLLHGNSGTPCAVEVQFSGGSKATYIGTSV